MDDLNLLEGWVQPLINGLDRKARTAMARKIAREVRKEQQQRIKAQRNPDGTAYAPRRTQRNKRGQIKRTAMFAKIRTARYMKATATANGATIQFVGPVAKIAEVHQYGLRDKIDRNKPRTHKYDARQLLGVAPKTRRIVSDVVLNDLPRR